MSSLVTKTRALRDPLLSQIDSDRLDDLLDASGAWLSSRWIIPSPAPANAQQANIELAKMLAVRTQDERVTGATATVSTGGESLGDYTAPSKGQESLDDSLADIATHQNQLVQTLMSEFRLKQREYDQPGTGKSPTARSVTRDRLRSSLLF